MSSKDVIRINEILPLISDMRDMKHKSADFKVPALKIIESYEIAMKSREEIPKELFDKIFYLARDIRKKVSHIPFVYTESDIEDTRVSERLREIANEGRQISLANPSSIEARIRTARLFSYGSDTFAAQLQDPKRGCSASICTNCDEPIVFCDWVCYVCDYELIGARSMPTVEEWEKMNLSFRMKSLREGFDYMMIDIHNRGDWRGKKSPLNRFKPAFVQWGRG